MELNKIEIKEFNLPKTNTTKWVSAKNRLSNVQWKFDSIPNIRLCAEYENDSIVNTPKTN